MALSATEEYIESSYFADDDYVGGVADGVVIMTPYFEESSDYIETGYVLDEGLVFSISAALEIAIIEGSATLICSTGLSADTGFFIDIDTEIFSGASASSEFTISATSGKTTQGSASISGAFSPTLSVSVTRTDAAQLDSSFSISTTAQRYRTDDALLTWQADLDASAAKTTAFDSTQSVQSSINIDAEVIISAASNFVSEFSQTATALNVILADAQLDTEFAAEISPIDPYRASLRPVLFVPQYLDGSTLSEGYPFSTGWNYNAFEKYGTYALILHEDESTAKTNKSIFVDDTTSFAVEGWLSGGSNSNMEFVLHNWFNLFCNQGDSVGADNTWTAAFKTDQTNRTLVITDNDSSFRPKQGYVYWALTYDADTNVVEFTVNNTSTSRTLGTETLTEYALNSANYKDTDNKLVLYNNRGEDLRFDEVRMCVGDTALYGYSNAIDDDANANDVGVWHFEESLSGGNYPGFTKTDNPTLSTSTSLSADTQKIVSGGADLDAFYSQVSVTGFVSDFFANADAAFGQTADVNRTRPGSADIDSSANTDIDINVVAGVTADILSTTTISTTGDRIRFADSDLNSNINISVSGNITGSGSADLSSAFSTNIDIERIRPGSSTQNTEFNTAITGIKAVNTDATLNTSTTITATPSITRGFDADIASTGSILTAAGRISNFFVNADVNINITADADITAEGTTTLETVAGITSTPSRTRGTDSTLEVAGTLEIGADTTKPGNATLNTAFDFDIDDTLFKTFSSTQSSAFALSIAYTKISPFSIDMDAAFDISGAGDRTRSTPAELTSAANINISTGVVYEGAATLPGFAAIISVNKILHLDQYIYNIDSETREYRLASESRVYRIPAENRIYKIKGA